MVHQGGRDQQIKKNENKMIKLILLFLSFHTQKSKRRNKRMFKPPEVIADHIAERTFWNRVRNMALFVAVAISISSFVSTVNRRAGAELLFGHH